MRPSTISIIGATNFTASPFNFSNISANFSWFDADSFAAAISCKYPNFFVSVVVEINLFNCS